MNQDIFNPKVAQAWSLTVGALGRGLVLAGLGLFAVCVILSLLSGKRPSLGKASTVAFVLGALTLFGTFICLGTLFVKDQFQYAFVFEHGDLHTAIQYKIAGIWSGQEGSFLLWAVMSAIFGLLTLRGAGPYRPTYLAVYSGFLGTLAGILAYETPFKILPDVVQNGHVMVPVTGQGMAPSLLNYWVVIHPPTIFLGFGSLTVFFAYSVAAILRKDLTDWIGRARPWVMVSAAILGVGICMGGFWAYETLGWGGFWGWDPVENASFIPWLFVVGLLHGMIVQTNRKRWHGSNLWLGALPFISFCYGTLLVRGGYLDKFGSVHTFANMDPSALTILKLFLLVVILGYTGLYLWRGRGLAKSVDAPKPPEVGINRETMYGAGVLFLSMLGAMLAIGISWPLIMAFMGRQASRVEEGLYHQVVVWFFLPIMLFIAVAPFVSWKTMGFRALVARTANVFSLAVAVTGVTLLLLRIPDWGIQTAANARVSLPFHRYLPATGWLAVLFLFCAFAFVANIWRIAEIIKRSPMGIGGFVAHAGVATLFAGLIMSRGFEQKEQVFVQEGKDASALGFTVSYKGLEGNSTYDTNEKALFEIKGPDGDSFMAKPGFYFRPMSEDPDSPMVWPYIRRSPFHDFYFTLGKPIVTVWDQPLQLQQGETKTQTGVTVSYKKLVTSGQLGTPSAKFIAPLHITIDGVGYDVSPVFSIAGGGAQFTRINDDYMVSLMRIDASDKSAFVQVFFSSAIFPVEIFTKPLTFLVWAGAGIMAFGSLIGAWSRRRIVKTAEVAAE